MVMRCTCFETAPRKGKGRKAILVSTLHTWRGIESLPCLRCACAMLQGDRSVEDLAGFATGEKVEKPEKPKEEPFYDGTGGL